LIIIFIVSDDLVINKKDFEFLEDQLNYYPIVTGWGVWRQNWDWTTIHLQDNFILLIKVISYLYLKNTII
jgi:hypothetical protein